ncbi:MAG: hypothetical protein M1818_003499 [Claussenomyces sp. TS43310]|nr:MAG: hypothetical protein M1818_003499 [Claussenomyces sp. TS43310]
MENPVLHALMFLYQLWQSLIDILLSPTPPPPHAKLGRPKVAVIGAGITGVSSAAHCVGHGFDVHIFEAGPRKNLGGIWSRVNNTSSLQIHSLMYRFFPSVQWKGGYPNREQIVSQVTELWKQYGLEERTTFELKAERVYQDGKGRWIINDPSNGRFDGIIAAVGTCGEAKMAHIPGQEKFKGEILHSSNLTGTDAKGKEMIIIGGGASAVEALEFAAHENAAKTVILARSDKWIIPRNPVIDVLLALNIFGQETLLSWIPETLLRKFFYRDLEDLAPSEKGLFTSTPMVNSDVMDKIRTGKADWLRGDIVGFTETGIKFNHRAKGVPKGGPGKEIEITGDMAVMATGFARPSLAFLPEEMFVEPYSPPNWYLQTFAPAHPSICANNCTYVDAIGAVGNWHIGIYTRVLLMFLVDPLSRPSPYWMKKVWWFCFCIVINPFRWKWAFFVFFGIGYALPNRVVRREQSIRNGLGAKNGGYDKGTSF